MRRPDRTGTAGAFHGRRFIRLPTMTIGDHLRQSAKSAVSICGYGAGDAV